MFAMHGLFRVELVPTWGWIVLEMEWSVCAACDYRLRKDQFAEDDRIIYQDKFLMAMEYGHSAGWFLM